MCVCVCVFGSSPARAHAPVCCVYAARSQGHLVYPAAAIVVIMDPDTRLQTFLTSTDDDIICLAQHPVNPGSFLPVQ